MSSVLDSTSRARAIGTGAVNKVFSVVGNNVQNKILVAGQYDPLKTEVVPNVPQLILNEADAGTKIGFGFPGHRLIKSVLKGTSGAGSVYWAPIEDAAGAVASAGEIAWTGPATAAGTISLRLANELYAVNIASGATVEEISDAVVAAVNAEADTPVIATKTAVTFETVFTAKSLGAAGDDITITLSADQSDPTNPEALPAGVTGVITAMTGGTGVPDIQDVLDAMGLNDNANEQLFTILVHGNGLDTTTMDAIHAYVGNANDFTGCWSKLIGRPFVCLVGDTTPGSAGLTALKVISDARVAQQANGIIATPDEDEVPAEIAAQAMGIVGKMAQADPAKNYSDEIISGVGGRSVTAQRWTDDYSSGRDFAVKNGISPTRVLENSVKLQNVISFYRPTSIPVSSNGWSSIRSHFVQLNVMQNLRALFEGDDYKGFNIVKDKSLVIDFEAAKSAIDIADVRADLNNFIDNVLVAKGLTYDGDYAKANSTIAIRAGSNGFDIVLKFIESGEGQIINVEQTFDKNIAAAS